MQDDLEMQPEHRSVGEMEQEHRGEKTRLRIGEHRQSAAFVGVPQRNLMEVPDSVERRPRHLEAEVPIEVGAGPRQVGEQRITAKQSE